MIDEVLVCKGERRGGRVLHSADTTLDSLPECPGCRSYPGDWSSDSNLECGETGFFA